jgi:hypothetical protein
VEGLSAPNTKAGRLQRACLGLLAEHEAEGTVPTSIRFLFYELVERDVIPKAYLHPDGKKKARQPDKDISAAVTVLREGGWVPWSYIADETRSLHDWRYAESVYRYVEDTLTLARIDLWDGEPPPLILCESRSLAGVLRRIANDYLCPIAATNGQVGGFLHTEIAPLVEETPGRRVLYLGDLDLAGGHIEANTRKVLEAYAPAERPLDWARVAITEAQVEEHGFKVKTKVDARYNDGRRHGAVETEKLGQAEVMRLLTGALEEAVPETLAVVLEREEEQRVRVRERLAGP